MARERLDNLFNLHPDDKPVLLRPNGCSTCQDILFNYLDSISYEEKDLKIIILSGKSKETQYTLGKLANNPYIIYDTNHQVISEKLVTGEEEIVLFNGNSRNAYTYLEYEKLIYLLKRNAIN